MLRVRMKNALLVPGVFFLSFLSALIVLSFFWGLGFRYEFTGLGSETSTFLFLCIAEKLCMMLPLITMFAVVGVYAFMMRHRTKLSVAVSLFAVCAIFTITVIMPVCYAQADMITASLNAFDVKPVVDRTLTAFIDKPFFLAAFTHTAEVLFGDIYNLYRTDFAAYLLFVGAFFFCVSSFWAICMVSYWTMLNLLFIFLTSGVFLLLYPLLHREVFQAALHNLHIASNESLLGIPIIFCLIGLLFHCSGILLVLVRSFKNKKRSAA